MAQKLRRWEVKLSDTQEGNLTYTRHRIDERKSMNISSISSGRTVLDMNLKINSEDDGEVTFDSPGGIQGDIIVWK